MITVKADDKCRIRIPGIKAGQVFVLENHGNGIITLGLHKSAKPTLGKVKFIRKDGYTVGITNRQVGMETIQGLLAVLH